MSEDLTSVLLASALVQNGQLCCNVDNGQALRYFDQAIAIAPGHGAAWAGRAMVLRSIGEHEPALMAFDRAAELQPEVGELWAERGFCLLDMGRLWEAVASFDAAIAREPDLLAACDGRAIAHQKLGRSRDALIGFRAVTELAPEDAVGWQERGAMADILGMFAEATEAYARYLKLAPADDDPVELDQVRRRLEALRAERPELPAWWALCVEAWREEAAGRPDDAASRYRQAIEQAPTERVPRIRHNLGELLERAGRPREAAACYLDVVAADGTQGMSWARLGACFLALAKPGPAYEALTHATEWLPDMPAAWLDLSRAAAAVGHAEEALAAARRAQALAPGDATARDHLIELGESRA